MSVLSDALIAEALYLDGNPQYVVPTSTLAFLDEAAEVLMAQEDLIRGIISDLDAALYSLEWGEIERLKDRLPKPKPYPM